MTENKLLGYIIHEKEKVACASAFLLAAMLESQDGRTSDRRSRITLQMIRHLERKGFVELVKNGPRTAEGRILKLTIAGEQLRWKYGLVASRKDGSNHV